MTHELEVYHNPHTLYQVKGCSGKEHAMHRELTGVALFYCNCGYSSGWLTQEELPDPHEFIEAHRSPWMREL